MSTRRRSLRIGATVLGAVGGFALGYAIVVTSGVKHRGAVLIGLTTMEGLIFMYLATPYVFGGWRRLDFRLRTTPLADLLAGIVGVIVGLVVAALASIFVRALPFGIALSAVLAAILAYIGGIIAVERRQEMLALITGRRPAGAGRLSGIVLDTSAIIDGRILEVARTGFLDQPLKVPRSVLRELQTLADSADTARRAKGRRGLELLGLLRQERRVNLEVHDDGDMIETVTDSRLVEIARKTGWALMTLDYNLNQVAQVEGVRVLNLNELTSALRQVAVPGDELALTLVKSGREPGQAVGYLDDGTMVVVENGQGKLNSRVTAVVTSVLQTAAGRMFFAQLPGGADDVESRRGRGGQQQR